MPNATIANMLAQSGANIGQAIGSPVAQIGRDIGGMLTARSERKAQDVQDQQVQKELQQYARDPAQLNAMGQKYQSMGKLDVAEAFYEAATQATAKRTAQVSSLESGGQSIQKEAQRKRAVQVARQKGDQGALTALNAGALDPVGYLNAQVGKKPSRQTANVSPGGAIVDEQTGEVIYERPFKPENPPAGKGVQMLERDDGSVSVVDGNSGELISTLPPTGEGGQAKREASLNLIAQTTGFIQDIDDLMDPGFTESGFVGGVTQMIPGTPAYDREKELLSIRARLGFDQINEMKRLAAESGASGTGLGQISNIEFMSLQSTIDAIYVGMSGEAQKEALAGIKKHLLNVQKLAAGVAPADAIEWDKPEYKAVGYHKDPETGSVFYAPDGPSGTVYKLMDGKFVKLGA